MVCADVLVEDGLLAEVLPALWALIGLLTRVDAQVLVQDRALPERTLAVHTCIWLLVCMDPKMLRQMRLLPESFPTFGAPVRTAIRVDSFMLE